MTDLQRHLKGVRKLVRAALAQGDASQTVDLAAVRAALRAFLPESYGIASGRICIGGQCSEPLEIIVYDVPLVGWLPPENASVQIEHALLVLHAAVSMDWAALEAVVAQLQSVKRLPQNRKGVAKERIPVPPGQARRIIPKSRLPYALLMLDHLAHQPHADESLYARLASLLGQYPAAQRPDEIEISGQSIHYLHPLLERGVCHDEDIGLSRAPDFEKPQICYVCKEKYFRQHFFYDRLCIRCADVSYTKRCQSADLTGRIALVTGARVKIGYAAALRLLRAGAEVIATSRFPRDAARRFAAEPDFDCWKQRLHVYGLDLRQIVRLESFIAYLYERYTHLDILVNNAAQTIKRPAAFYAHLIPLETAPHDALPEPIRALLHEGDPPTAPALLESADDHPAFPFGQLDEHGQQVDNRSHNSWTLRLDEVSIAEMLEVHLVNAVAPGVLAGQLKALMERSPHTMRFIVNVSAVEGQFAQRKRGIHPHTNMAKAALNMLTRSIAADYAESRIYVNSVDPGWVSDQVPRESDHSRAAAAEILPIDMIDAAARICDPIFSALKTGQPITGRLLKDYREVDW